MLCFDGLITRQENFVDLSYVEEKIKDIMGLDIKLKVEKWDDN
jgi:hypothetical protein